MIFLNIYQIYFRQERDQKEELTKLEVRVLGMKTLMSEEVDVPLI